MRTDRLHALLLILTVLLLTTSCERRELVAPSNTHYVRVYINEELPNVTTGFYNTEHARPEYKAPVVLRLILADPITGVAQAERFLRDRGHDHRGTYYEGYIVADPGTYTLMAYNFDTETTQVVGYTNHQEACAYTNEIATHLYTRIPSRTATKAEGDTPTGERERIVYEPDHLFTANCGEVTIAHSEAIDTLCPAEGGHFMAESIVKSYYLQIRVEGMEYATSSVGLLTGMSGSSWVNGSGMKLDDNVTVYFEMQPGENAASGMKRSNATTSAATIYTTFSTFGKLPDAENELEITFDFLTTYGKPYSEAIDITPYFATPEAINNQWLIINHTIKIPEPPPGPSGGGGFNPGVSDWTDVNTDIQI